MFRNFSIRIYLPDLQILKETCVIAKNFSPEYTVSLTCTNILTLASVLYTAIKKDKNLFLKNINIKLKENAIIFIRDLKIVLFCSKKILFITFYYKSATFLLFIIIEQTKNIIQFIKPRKKTSKLLFVHYTLELRNTINHYFSMRKYHI